MVFPQDFEQRERSLLGERFEEIYTYRTEDPARGITVNTLRCAPEAVAAQSGLALEKSDFCKAAFRLKGEAHLGRHPYHHAGVFYVQEPSASSAAALPEVQPGMKVADLCAAPGGKTSQLAAALQGEGLLIANEYAAGRAEILRQNLERMGVKNAVVFNEDTARLAAAFPNFFDRILVDAPCSGEGMFRKEAAAIPQHNNSLVEQCAVLGREILDNAAVMLNAGGVLVLSTCTFAPQEDEGQVAAFLQRHPEFELCDLSGVGFGSSGEANRAGDCPPETAQEIAAKTRRIWPKDGGEGHFIAKLKKCGEAQQTPKYKPDKPVKPPKEWLEFAKEYFPKLADKPLTAVKDWLLLAPEIPLPPHRLHTLRAGVLAGSVQKGRFVPEHALFMAYGTECTNKEELTLDDPRVAVWLHGEEIEAKTAHKGWCAVLVDGFPLGCGKMAEGRIKNHYPKALRNKNL